MFLSPFRLSYCGLDQSDCKHLASVLHSESSSLLELDLSHNDVGDDGLKELFPGLQRLEILRLDQFMMLIYFIVKLKR